MIGKILILVALGLLCVVQSRRPIMRDFSRGMKPFQRDDGDLFRSEDEDDYRRQKDPLRRSSKFAMNDEDEDMMDVPNDMESPMSDEGEETFDERTDMDLPLEDEDDVEEIIASDEGENQTTQPPTETPSTEATTEAPSSTAESTTTTTEAATTTTETPSSTSQPIATTSPSGLSEELAQALKGLSSKVAKQEKFCSYLMEKLQAAWSTTATPATATDATTGATKSTTTPAEPKTSTHSKTTESATVTGSPWGTVATPVPTTDSTPVPTTDSSSVPTRVSTLVPTSETKNALSRLSSMVARQGKNCSFLIEKLKDRIYGSLATRLQEIEASIMKSIGDIQVGRKRSANSLLENLLAQLRDMRMKMRKHRS